MESENNINLDEVTNEEVKFDEIPSLDSLEGVVGDVVVESAEESDLVEQSPDDFEFQLDCLDNEEQEDMLWKAKTGLNEETLCGAIETIVFMSDRPINLQKIKSYIDPDLPLRVIHHAISRLQEEYERSHHGIRLQEVAEGYQFRTKATYSKYIQDIFKINSLTLSPTALEVLAIIAYKQPISKTEVEKIRGVDSSHIIRALMDKRLVNIVGRSNEIGRPLLCGTTLEFLEVFNLKSIDELPKEYELEELATASEVGAISEIKEICYSDKALFNFDDIHELDELRETIKSISVDTPFTKSLEVEGRKRQASTEEAGTIKSAFELLEEYIHMDHIEDANKNANESDVLTTDIEPRVVDLQKEEGVINAPLIDDNVENMWSEKEAQAEEMEKEEVIDIFPQAKGIDLQEAKLLSDALDEAFSRLGIDFTEEDNDTHAEIEEKMDALDETTERIMDSALDFDIDLGFMKENAMADSLFDEGEPQ